MKKNLNIIQIRGVRGLIFAGFVVTCLFAGFVVFPGWVSMHCWNFISAYTNNLPQIGLFQGVLLWGIIAASYFIFRKEKVVVCMRSPQGLSEEELKSVFADIKKQSQDDPILQAMLKARETELNLKSEQATSENSEQPVSTEQK
ncbi:MAG: hypothetical protein E7Z89_07850 [Cyanobacteria bacterium SIG28]|nr:hypothetical protein [Cyanobacteria bacterium SIG28]